jgi:AraC-like DNA-binding protein
VLSDIDRDSENSEELLDAFQSFVRAKIEWSSRPDVLTGKGGMAANGLSAWHMECSADWIFRPPQEEERFWVTFPSAGVMGATIRNKPIIAEPGTALVAGVPEIPQMWARSVGAHARTALKWDVALVDKILSTIFDGAALRDIDLDPKLDLSSPPGQTLELLARTIFVSASEGSIKSDKAGALLSEAALRLIFENFPHRLSERLNRRQLDAMPRHIRTAIEFMHANLHLPLTLGDIAQAAGVSARSLQIGFQQFRDTTPLAYLRDVRLQAAHEELSLPENILPISEVALKWGFTQMGRFAARYKAVYGLLPSETARRAR